jgi:hypothetical protein
MANKSALRPPAAQIGIIVCQRQNKRSVGKVVGLEPHPHYKEPMLIVRWQNGTVSREFCSQLYDYDSVVVDLEDTFREAADRRARADTLKI